ncbi:transposase [Microtetraspora sp. AC03309]|uniref:IS701 family transposase n=1 Tax=Microtetraspora sp. AC03309 TaxID=2779376 RepID=UPI0035AE891F|nr:transposase [Microtetraspora sp. AC03309]
MDATCSQLDPTTATYGSSASFLVAGTTLTDLLSGLLSELPRKNCWTLAEHAGDRTPDGTQHLLSRAVWDADAVRDDLRGYVVEHLGQDGAGAGGGRDRRPEEGHRHGRRAAPVHRHRRIDRNSQVAVFLAYSTPAGHAFIDRELYLPQAWTGDAERCRRAGVPQDRQFATKGELATWMVARALDAGVQARWVAGDEVYGQSPYLRAELEARKVGYVLAVASSHRVTTGAGACRADQVIFSVAQASWQRLSAGHGAKGHRYYDWAAVELDCERPGRHWLLIRRNRRTSEHQELWLEY